MNKTMVRCLSLAIVVVGVMVIGSGVAMGQGTGLGVSITCDASVAQGETDATYDCNFTVINGGGALNNDLVVTIDGNPVSCFIGTTAVTDLGASGAADDRCTGTILSGMIPFTCSATDVVRNIEITVAATDANGSAGGGTSVNVTVLGINCSDQNACTTESCVPTSTGVVGGCTTPVAITPCGGIDGRMTGGGSVFDGLNRITHGFALNCNVANLPNRLQINWGRGNRFHLTELTSATCTDDTTIDQRPPGHSTFDTYVGTGTGTCNGVPGAEIEFTFTDYGEPGKLDTATILITGCPTGVDPLSVSNTLKTGNHQAHRAN